MMLVLEISRPKKEGYAKNFYGTLIASAVGLGLYFAVAGTVFIGIYDVPKYEFKDWHLFAAVVLGILAALVAVVAGSIGAVIKKLVDAARIPELLLPVLGGLAFGLLGVMLPLTLFTGSDQVSMVLQDSGRIGTWLLVATLLGKMVAFSVSSATRFIGGPIFPILFMGGVSGVIVNQVVPDVPLGLAFTCMLAAVPGAIVPAPFSMVLLAVLMTQVGPLQTTPVLIAVGTSFLALAGIRDLMARRTEHDSSPVEGTS